MTSNTKINWIGAILIASGIAALSQTPQHLPKGPLVAKSLTSGQRCDQVIKYSHIPPQQLKQSAMPIARSFVQSGEIAEVTAHLANGSKSVGFLTDKLILQSNQGIGVESLANAEPSTVEQFDCLSVARWATADNFSGMETTGGKELWRFAKSHPLFGEQVVLINPETHLPMFYSDVGKIITFSYSQDDRPVKLPPELERAQQRFLSLYPDGIAPRPE